MSDINDDGRSTSEEDIEVVSDNEANPEGSSEARCDHSVQDDNPNGARNDNALTRGEEEEEEVSRLNGNSENKTSKPVVIREIPIGDYSARSKLTFEVVTARVVEVGGKKHVVYSVMIRRKDDPESRPAVIDRRYNDFCYVYECILRSFHPSVLGDFMFPKKVLIGNFKAEVITERTDAFHKFLNLIAGCENLLYSDYFYAFLSSDEHNEAVSLIKLSGYAEAVPLLENIFNVREKLLTISSIHVLWVLCELIACQEAAGEAAEAFAYCLVASKAFELQAKSPSNPEIVELFKIPFLLTGLRLAETLDQNKKPFEKQIAELRYKGVKVSGVKSLLEMIREKYIHRASHTTSK